MIRISFVLGAVFFLSFISYQVAPTPAHAQIPDPCEPDASSDGEVGLVDLSLFAQHFGPPGHMC